jgi:hypothetical protein
VTHWVYHATHVWLLPCMAGCRYTTEEAGALAHRIARTAHRYASDPYQRTPWSVASCEQVGGWVGGDAWARGC